MNKRVINYFVQSLNPYSILPSGANVTLYMMDCSHYELRENKRHLSCGFPWALRIIVKMPRSCCCENCSNNKKSQPNLNFCILPSDKQRCRRWLQAVCRAQQRLTFLHYLIIDQLYGKEVYFCSFETKFN